MTVLGIVGAMGAGKTVVLEMLGRLGAATIRADDLSRQLLTPGAETAEQVRAAFGDEFFDPQGNLLRGKLAGLIFASEAARRRLNDIMYPAMVALLRQLLQQLRQDPCRPTLVAVEAANLYEMGADGLVDCVLRVKAPRSVRLERIRSRDGLTAEEARRRLASHTAAGLDEGPADHELDTDKPLERLQDEVQALYQALSEVCQTEGQ